jgi:HK97 gp10 family phage protein
MIGFDTSDLLRAVAETVGQVTPDEQTLRAAGVAGADVFREEAKHNAASHAKTWTIHRNIIMKHLPEDSDGAVRQAYLVTVRKGDYGGGDAFYWRFVERGHKFVPKNTKVSAKTGKKIGWAAHRHAAELEYGNARVPAYPFMRPAYESKKGDAMNAMTLRLKEQLVRNATR